MRNLNMIKSARELIDNTFLNIQRCADALENIGLSLEDEKKVKHAKSAFIKAMNSVSFDCCNCEMCSCCEYCDECKWCLFCSCCNACSYCDTCTNCCECSHCNDCYRCELCHDCSDCSDCRGLVFCFGLNGVSKQFFKADANYQLTNEQKFIIDFAADYEKKAGFATATIHEAQLLLKKAKRKFKSLNA